MEPYSPNSLESGFGDETLTLFGLLSWTSVLFGATFLLCAALFGSRRWIVELGGRIQLIYLMMVCMPWMFNTSLAYINELWALATAAACLMIYRLGDDLGRDSEDVTNK